MYFFVFLTIIPQQFQTLAVYSFHYTLKSALNVVPNYILVKTRMIYFSVRKCQGKRGNFLFLENDTRWTTPGRVTWWSDIAYIMRVSSIARYKDMLMRICRCLRLHIKTTCGRFLITTPLIYSFHSFSEAFIKWNWQWIMQYSRF